MQHAVGAGLEQQHAGQMEHQSWILRLLQVLYESLAVQELSLSVWNIFTNLGFLKASSLEAHTQSGEPVFPSPFLFLVSFFKHEPTDLCTAFQVAQKVFNSLEETVEGFTSLHSV